MEIHENNPCIKITLPNGKVADILTPVLDEIWKWLQNKNCKPESGGYIVGYLHKRTGNISLEKVSPPYSQDIKDRYQFSICDPQHEKFLQKAQEYKSYYMGVWHTHPQSVPVPSSIDWKDWHESLKTDRTGCQYIFFIVAGINSFRIWIGDILTGEIVEGEECCKDKDGIYQRF